MPSGILLLFGIGIVGGLVSALMAQKVKIPQVLGYIIAGLILGESGFKIVTSSDISSLEPFNNFALGIIGFLVGSELKFGTLKKYAPQFSALLIGEALLAFTLVLGGTGAIIYMVTGSLAIALSGGIILGAIASATDPASTISVLWEQRSAGILTTTIIAVIALDDALAMLLYGIGSGVARVLTGGSDVSVVGEMGKVGLELGSSMIIGLTAGFFVAYIMKKSPKAEQAVALSLGIILLAIGLAVSFNLDIIIVAMTIGIILANTVPVRSEELIGFFKTISLPIYAIFFVLIGARISIGSMPLWIWGIVGAYVSMRTIGKYLGARAGATLSKSDPKVIKYAGLGLFAQGGVAIGLSIMAAHHFESIAVTPTLMLSDVIVFTVATTTLFVQIIGPFAVKIATKLSGEAHKDLTEDDIIADKTIGHCTSAIIPTIKPSATIQVLFELLTKTDAAFIPVIDDDNNLLGTITLAEVKELFLDPTSWQWIIISDVMAPHTETVSADMPLEAGIQLLSQLHTEQIPVVQDGKYEGILDRRVIRSFIRTEMVQLRSQHA